MIRDRFGLETFSGAYGVTEASLISWQPPGVENRPNAAGVINDQYFDVRIFDDDDHEIPAGIDGEIVIRPKRPHVMFEGYWGRPDGRSRRAATSGTTPATSGGSTRTRFLYFVDRKADYLRRRGENIASFEVERILMGHGALADVAVHAVPSPMTEDDLKITATRGGGGDPHRGGALPLVHRPACPTSHCPASSSSAPCCPRSPVGRVLKRELRTEGVTASTWDAEAAGITYERR